MRRSLILVAIAGLSAVAAAQKAPHNQVLKSTDVHSATLPTNVFTPTIISQTESLGTTTLVVDVSGIESWDGIDDLSNTVLAIPLGAGASFTGIGWDVNITTQGGSWLSEAAVYMDNSAQAAGISLSPGAGDNFAGSDAYSSGGVVDFGSIPLPDISILGDGNLYLQFFEGFDDANDVIDATWDAPSTLTIKYTPGAPPAVPTVSQWGLVLLGVGLLGGVVVMTMRRKTVTA